MPHYYFPSRIIKADNAQDAIFAFEDDAHNHAQSYLEMTKKQAGSIIKTEALAPEMRDALLAVFSLWRREIEEDEPIRAADFLALFLEWRADFADVLAKLEGR
jgi:hypothetical protein